MSVRRAPSEGRSRLHALRGWLRSLPGAEPAWQYVRRLLLRRNARPSEIPAEGAEPGMKLLALPGIKLFADRDDEHIGKAVAGGGYEPHVTAVLRRLLRRGHGFLDVGANIGFHALLAARRVGRRGRVIAVEMMPRNCDLLRASVRINGFRNVTVHQVAAAEHAQTVAFCQPVGSGNGTLASDYINGLARLGHFGPPVTARAVAVDDLIPAGLRIHVVKMDVEGAEARALRGMDHLLRVQRPTLVFEFYPHLLRNVGGLDPLRLLEMVRSYGYDVRAVGRESGAASAPLDDGSVMALVEPATGHAYVDLLATPCGAGAR